MYKLLLVMASLKAGSMNLMLLLSFTLILCCLGFCSSLVAGASTMRRGDELNSSSASLLVSEGGVFTLGFFTIPIGDVFGYLGIWDTDDKENKVWIANPNTPIVNNIGVLTIDGKGRLKVMSGGSTVVNINDEVGSGNVSATLEDSGNFVVKDESDNRILWQSFDHPTSMQSQGMKLGFNLTSGQNWTLTSWLSDFYPSTGTFTLSWESTQESGQLIIHHRGERYWTSGELKDGNFEHMQLNDSYFNHRFRYVSASDGSYFTFSPTSLAIPPKLELTPNGRIVDNLSKANLTSYEFCYGYESDDGCVRSTVPLPECRRHGDKFHERQAAFSGNTRIRNENQSLGVGDCMKMCWNDCNCVGFMELFSVRVGCAFWGGNINYTADEPNLGAMYVLVPAHRSADAPSSPIQSPSAPIQSPTSSNGEKKWIWIVTVVVVAVLMLLFGLLCFLRRRLKGNNEERVVLEHMTPNEYMNIDELEHDGNKGHDIEGHSPLKLFSFACIRDATSSFASECKLGEGGFGPVYKGKLPTGREIAVKRLSRSSGQGLVEFQNELILIAKLQHMNLVRLLGCCIQGDEKMLVYEYMPNKSLDSFLFDTTKKEQLTWERRLSVVEGIAQGLLYLHKYSRVRIIHRDLKASNILLDENMNPKISDFGMARIYKHNVSEANTNRVVGTYGYMAPEYAMEGIFSVKSDVFSFGVLMLEIVSGRRNNSFHDIEGPLNLVGFAWELWNKDAALELVDLTLRGSYVEQQLLRCIHVGLLCVEDHAMDRPTMLEVISMLTNDSMALPMPKKPGFITRSRVAEEDVHKSKQENYSLNGLSISVLDAR
ncbi:G-type lectin S-receptor-like serine/threonine-protein kinase At1g67520 [Cornus florida]|uniref:G-type lectin S-receptor-like serine/threonine-protein kinase At1g67520 n=1 Tax=Cornus florida TaxID=4283 RepID=UPI00289EB449|nr:G-type lectin S-receptor-like serine/threonine-protein kinase At1g67520 [Cornus florida]